MRTIDSRICILCILFIFIAGFHLCHAQYPPPFTSDNVTVIHSPVDGDITISYKSPSIGTCTTVFSTQQQYTGYVSLPPNSLNPSQGNYTINSFFWFIEARQLPETAPLTIFINGGPGSSSMVGLFQEVGPCSVVEISNGQLGTIAREWGWDRSSNILFIDQPVQVGFSYDVLTNASLNLLDQSVISPATTRPITQPSYTFLNGTFSSGNSTFTANTSQIAAQAVWHFLQGWLGAFPQYNPGTRPNGTTADGVARINLFTESYGGKYGPAFGTFFNDQNTIRAINPSFASNTIDITLDTLGIMNGWIDLLVQTPYHPRYAFNNTYQIQAISQVDELNALSDFNGADGCQQQTTNCRAQEIMYDPLGSGDVEVVNSVCSSAQYYCQNYVTGPYGSSDRSVYDISQNVLNPFPDNHYLEYLNNVAVQQAIGVPVNYTQDSLSVFTAFNETGDYARNGILNDIVSLLNSGVRVALINGDRDYICNWLGGEAISFAIAGAAGPAYLPWYAAGYAPIVANSSYIGGVVREYGNLSFSRIYDAGHLVPAYQPETAFTVFSRVILGTDISLGSEPYLNNAGSEGDSNSTYENSAPSMASPTCFVRAVNTTCDTDQRNMLANSAGVIINGVLYASAGDWSGPNPTVATMAGMPGTAPLSMMTSAPSSTKTSASTKDTKTNSEKKTSSTSIPTGVYTATAVPTMTSTTARNEATRLAVNSALRDTQPALMLGLIGFSLFC